MADMRPEDMRWPGYRSNPTQMPIRASAQFEPAYAGSTLLPPRHGSGNVDYELSPDASQQDLHPSRRVLQTEDGPRPVLTSHHSYPFVKRAFENYNDSSYSDAASVADDGLQDAEVPSILSDHRLLFFGTFKPRHTIMNQYGRTASVDVAAQLHGMFFFSEMTTGGNESATMQPELTCYRRNLFQISGSVTIPRGPLSILLPGDQVIPIATLGLSISALESVDGHAVKLIVIPWKTPPPNAPEIPSNQEQEPAPIPLFRHGDNTKDTGDLIVESIAWRRLQFRTATANNGRRKELQQHFLLRMTLDASLANGTTVCIGESATVPIVVRGRSPRNFQTRKEIPLVGSSAAPRGQASQSSPIQRRVVSDPSKSQAVSPTGLELPTNPFEMEQGNFVPSTYVHQGYGQRNSPQLHSSPGAGTAPNSATPHASMTHPTYLYNLPQLPDIHGGVTIPVSAPQTENSMRSPFYRSNTAPSSTLPLHHEDYGQRPSKSSRQTYVSTAVTPPFEDRSPAYDVNGQPLLDYFPPAVPSQMWTTAEQTGIIYSTTMPPPSASPYAYPPAGYVKSETQPTQYSWNS